MSDESLQTNIDVDAVVKKWQAQSASTAGETPPEAGEAPAEGTAAEAKPEAVDEAAQLRSKQLAALARKEETLLDRERQLDARLKELELKAAEADTIKARLEQDPFPLLREHGHTDLGLFANEAWADELGDNAPAEFKQKIRERQLQAKNQQLDARLKALEEDREKAAETAAIQAKAQIVDREINQLVANPPENLQFFGRLAAAKPEEAQRAVVFAMKGAIQQGHWPSVNEMASAINEQLEEDARLLTGGATPTSQTSQDTASETASNTPNIADVADESPDRASMPETVQDDDYYIQRALRAMQGKSLVRD